MCLLVATSSKNNDRKQGSAVAISLPFQSAADSLQLSIYMCATHVGLMFFLKKF